MKMNENMWKSQISIKIYGNLCESVKVMRVHPATAPQTQQAKQTHPAPNLRPSSPAINSPVRLVCPATPAVPTSQASKPLSLQFSIILLFQYRKEPQNHRQSKNKQRAATGCQIRNPTKNPTQIHPAKPASSQPAQPTQPALASSVR